MVSMTRDSIRSRLLSGVSTQSELQYEEEAARTDFLEFPIYSRSNSNASLVSAAICDASCCFYTFKSLGVHSLLSEIGSHFRFTAPD